jgi:MATE family multidrug resistance protein
VNLFKEKSLYFLELKKVLQLAWPILIAQFALMGLGLVDTLMSGQVSTDDLAAIGLGSGLMMPVFMFATGILLAISPIVAKAKGGQDFSKIKSVFQQGFWLALPLGILSFWVLWYMDTLLNWLSLTPHVRQLTKDYLVFLALVMPGIAFYQALRFFWEGLGQTRPTMLISIFALVLNIPLNALFIYGGFGVPAYGAAGCGIASSIVMWSMLFIGLLYIYFSPKMRYYVSITQLFTKISLQGSHKLSSTFKILKLGIPNTLAILFEVGMFSFISVFIAILGSVVLAAHQVAMSVSSFLFMIPLSLSLATSVRTGQLYGERNFLGLQRLVRVILVFSVLISIATSIILMSLNSQLAGLFAHQPEVIHIAASLLMLAGVYQLFDAVQSVSNGVLRGLHHTKTTMQVAFVSYWLIGLGIGYVLTFKDWIMPAMGVKGFWWGIIIGLFIGAILLLLRLRFQMKCVYLPAVSG